MNYGIDIGYNAVKAVSANGIVYFPSVVGTPDMSSFSANGTTKNIVVSPDGMNKMLIGEAAILQSRFPSRPESRNWIVGQEYKYLLAAALSELTTASRVDVRIVTGLPSSYFKWDKETLREQFMGTHRVERGDGSDGRSGTQIFNVVQCKVIPQPFGTILSEAMDSHGKALKNDLAEGIVGVIDLGGHTTNLQSVHRLTDVGRGTHSVKVGAWDAIRAVQEYLAQAFPDLNKRDHEIVEIVKARKVKYHGEVHDVTDQITQVLEGMARQVLTEASKLWSEGGDLDAILVTGGGALLLGSLITPAFPRARIVADPVYANARGYYNLSQRP